MPCQKAKWWDVGSWKEKFKKLSDSEMKKSKAPVHQDALHPLHNFELFGHERSLEQGSPTCDPLLTQILFLLIEIAPFVSSIFVVTFWANQFIIWSIRGKKVGNSIMQKVAKWNGTSLKL